MYPCLPSLLILTGIQSETTTLVAPPQLTVSQLATAACHMCPVLGSCSTPNLYRREDCLCYAQVIPTRKVRKLGQAGKPAGGYNGPAVDDNDEPPAAFDPDALLPRTDISSQITSKLVANLSANWKERNAALDEVDEIIKSAGGRIQPTVGDLMPALKVCTNERMACCDWPSDV